MFGTKISLALLLACAAVMPAAARNLALDDMFNERDVSDPQISPDGNWIAYSVKQMSAKDDASYTHIWMSSFDGSRRPVPRADSAKRPQGPHGPRYRVVEEAS